MSTSDSDDEAQCVVLDNGSGRIKAGFAGDKTVSTVFPCLLAKSKSKVSSKICAPHCKKEALEVMHNSVTVYKLFKYTIE